MNIYQHFVYINIFLLNSNDFLINEFFVLFYVFCNLVNYSKYMYYKYFVVGAKKINGLQYKFKVFFMFLILNLINLINLYMEN